MSSDHSPPAEEAGAAAAKKPPKSRAGRLVVYTAYAVVATWSIGATITSVLVDLYGPAPAPGQVTLSSGDQRWCVRSFNALWAALDTRLGQVTHGVQGESGDAWQQFSEQWTPRLDDARSRCGGGDDPNMQEALTSLERLHAGYSRGMGDIGSTRAKEATQFRAAMRNLLGRR